MAMEYDRMKEVKAFDDSKIGVKGLVDSGITTIPRFFIHPPENLPDPNRKSSSPSIGIPIIDLSNIQRSQIVDQVREAACAWGFFQVINHNIPLNVLDNTINAIKSFHEQPSEIKKIHYVRDESVSYFSNIDLFKSEVAGWFDSLLVTLAPNPEIDRIPEACRDEVMAWDDHTKRLAEMLMEILCEGLGLENNGMLKELGCLDGRTFAGHYYPYCPQWDLTMGIPSHTDGGVLTVLLQDQMGGLQIKDCDEWVDIKPLPGALVINVGHFMQILSNDRYKSCEHRVLANAAGQPRISSGVFFNVGGNKDDSFHYGPLDELLTPEKPALYRKFKLSEFTNKFF